MKALEIARFNLIRMLRERSNIFFVFIFPIALILLIGIQFGGGQSAVVGVHQEDSGTLASAVVAELEDSGNLEVSMFPTRDELVSAVERGTANAGLFLPPAWKRRSPEATPPKWVSSSGRTASGTS